MTRHSFKGKASFVGEGSSYNIGAFDAGWSSGGSIGPGMTTNQRFDPTHWGQHRQGYINTAAQLWFAHWGWDGLNVQ